MGQSVWLFMWLLDRMTSVSEEGVGKVLGGRPITHVELEESLGISKRTYVRWVELLRTGGYIETLRTPNGLCISVNKAKKSFGNRSAKSGVSEVPQIVREVPKVAYRSAKSGASNIRQYNTINKDNVIKNDFRGQESAAKEKVRAMLKEKGLLK